MNPGGLGQRAVFVCNHEAKNIYTNAAYQSMTGTTPEELLGLGWISFVHPDDLPVSPGDSSVVHGRNSVHVRIQRITDSL